MKRLLFLLLMVPFVSSAQNWHLITEGGILLNSKTNKATATEHASPIGGTGAIGLSYQQSKNELGILFAYRPYAFKHVGDFYFEDQFDPLTGYVSGPPTHIEFVEPLPALAFSPFYHYHFGHARLASYVGISASYIRFFSQTLRDGNGKPYRNLSNGANGYGLDLQFGEQYRLSEWVSCFTQLSVGTVDMPPPKERAQMLSGSLVFGFRFGRNGQK